jgi:hypothetical protein
MSKLLPHPPKLVGHLSLAGYALIGVVLIAVTKGNLGFHRAQDGTATAVRC